MKKQSTPKVSKQIKQIITAILLGGGITVALFYLCAIFIVKQTLSHTVFAFFATATICLGCFISSFLLGFQRKSGVIFCSMLCFIIFATTLLLGRYLYKAEFLSATIIARFTFLIVAACLGSYFGVIKAEKIERNRRKIGV